jgi:hypothetical protein
MPHFLFFGCRHMSFCKNSLAVTKVLIPMASFLHVKKLALSHFILANFFHTMYRLVPPKIQVRSHVCFPP